MQLSLTNFLDSRRAILAFAVRYVLVLFVHVVAAVGGGVLPDQARDTYFAARIAAGLEFPLGGPVIYDTFQLGPLWLYLCAVPLALGGGFVSVAIFTAVLSTFKYPLAFWLGHRAVDARFG